MNFSETFLSFLLLFLLWLPSYCGLVTYSGNTAPPGPRAFPLRADPPYLRPVSANPHGIHFYLEWLRSRLASCWGKKGQNEHRFVPCFCFYMAVFICISLHCMFCESFQLKEYFSTCQEYFHFTVYLKVMFKKSLQRWGRKQSWL